MDPDDVETIEKFRRYSEYASDTLIYLFLDFLTFKGIPFVVAPYEADSQLAYMFQTRQIDIVFSEDSDLVAYGCTEIARHLKMNETVKYFSFNNLRNDSPAIEQAFVRLGRLTRPRHPSQGVHHDRLRLPLQLRRRRLPDPHEAAR